MEDLPLCILDFLLIVNKETLIGHRIFRNTASYFTLDRQFSYMDSFAQFFDFVRVSEI